MEQEEPQFDKSVYGSRKTLHISNDNNNPYKNPNRNQLQNQNQNQNQSKFGDPIPNHANQPEPKYPLNPMFSPQPRPSSPLVGNSPPSKKIRSTKRRDDSPGNGPSPGLNYFLPERHTPGQIGQNLSYARTFHTSDSRSSPPGVETTTFESSHAEPPKETAPKHRRQGSESDEDERFLRLAREALVATANGVNASGSTLVDPTIQDLLRRLQYAASPHGNPIKRSDNIRANANGQLMIQGFYQQFPNLSNDIFMGNEKPAEGTSKTSNHPSSLNDGWNFLIGEPVTLKGGTPYNAKKAAFDDEHDDEDDEDDDDDSDERDENEGSARKTSEDPSRKFLCTKCTMSFRRSSDLKRHEKQHLIIPPNICELCGKGFARKDALKRHMGTLTCRRNADKNLYEDNLKYLEVKRGASSTRY